MTRRAVLVLFLTMVLPGLFTYWAGASRSGFPHEDHEGLFPICTPCHAGIAGGETARFFTVGPENCAACHDGDLLDPVEWTAPTPRTSYLIFDHTLHVEDNEMACMDCHQNPKRTGRMEVVLPEPTVCMDCHGEGDHLSSTDDCTTCHPPVTETGLSAAQIADFPRPPGHGDPEFHGAIAKKNRDFCGVCHTPQRCKTCHEPK